MYSNENDRNSTMHLLYWYQLLYKSGVQIGIANL